MNYRGLNNIIRKDYYFLPLIKKTLNSILKTKYFTKLVITAVFYKFALIKDKSE